MIYPRQWYVCNWKECYCATIEWNVWYTSIKFIGSNVSFKGIFFSLIFYLNDLSIDEIGVLQSPTIPVLVLISVFIDNICFMYLVAPTLGAHSLKSVISSCMNLWPYKEEFLINKCCVFWLFHWLSITLALFLCPEINYNVEIDNASKTSKCLSKIKNCISLTLYQR